MRDSFTRAEKTKRAEVPTLWVETALQRQSWEPQGLESMPPL